MISVTVGICAYNEAVNITKALNSVYKQDFTGLKLDRIIVVSSGSTDDTDRIIESMIPEHPRLQLAVQEKRLGKNSAVNRILDSGKSDVIVLMNADNILNGNRVVYDLVSPFTDSKVGMTGGHPVPTNDVGTFTGFASHMVWCMHHHVAEMTEKRGELVAFRDIGTRLNPRTQGDEDRLAMALIKAGYKTVYVPEAKVFNRGPDTVADYIKQRTRTNIGELYIKKDTGYKSPTWDVHILYTATIGTIKNMGFHPLKIMFAVSLEILCRVSASVHIRLRKKDICVWDRVCSTKKI